MNKNSKVIKVLLLMKKIKKKHEMVIMIEQGETQLIVITR